MGGIRGDAATVDKPGRSGSTRDCDAVDFGDSHGVAPTTSRPARSRRDAGRRRSPAGRAGPRPRTPAPAPSFEAAPGAVTLVAYTTPREAYAGDHPAVPGDRGRRRRPVRGVLRPVRRPEPRRRGRPAGRHRGALAVAGRGAARGAGHRAADWDDNEHDGIVHNSVVVFAVRPGNPKGIPRWDDLDPRGRRGHHAQPAHLRRRAVEHPGGLPGADRRRARPRKRPSSTCVQLVASTSPSGTAAPATR